MENENINTNSTDTQMNSTNESKSESFANEALTSNTNYGTISALDIETGTAELVLIPPFEGDDGGISVACVEGDNSSCNMASQTDMDNATLLTLNQWKCDSITDTVSERWYRFDTENETEPKMKVYYTIYTTGNTNTTGRLYDYQGNFVTINGDHSGSLNFKIVHMLAASSTYYVKVTTPSSERGDFEIRVIKRVLPIISKYSTTLNIGDTDSISTIMLPNSTSNFCVEYSSNNPDIASVTLHTGDITAVDAGIAVITARDTINNDIIGECEVWVRGKIPVFLLHGRIDDTENVWGAQNALCGYNNHFVADPEAFSTSGTTKYIDKVAQEITGISDNDEEHKYLAYELKFNNYEENVNLFAFNYPNKDAVVHSAIKFERYIENLISYVRTCEATKIKACFYSSRTDFYNNNYKINIVAHSMGGLVARYYIENLAHSNHVERLITVCTPHWGVGLVNCGYLVDQHELCDHDIEPESSMFGAHERVILDFCAQCIGFDTDYPLTERLEYENNRVTKYYAISGISRLAGLLSSNFKEIDISTCESYSDIQSKIGESVQGDVLIKSDDDNVVGFLSQIGWTNNEDVDVPQNKISMYKTLLFLYSAPLLNYEEWNFWWDSLHIKMPHKEDVIRRILEFLSN